MDDGSHCGCCEGADKLPSARDNAIGESAIAYRAGTHASFKAALVARLSSVDYPALSLLRTRSDDDFAIAACDATATLLDVLTFYQERYANELYLRTATERRSVVELARLIGYQPSPGVAASTRLAFLLEEAPGAPALAAEPVTIAIGAKVQSVPGPGEDPQTFETVEEKTARVEWNAIPVQTTERQTFAIGATEIVLAGVTVQLQPSDVILIVGDERIGDVQSHNWDARVVDTVERDNDRQITRVTLSSELGDAGTATNPAALNPRTYVFRQRAGLFGHNAPDPNLLFNTVSPPTGMTTGSAGSYEWAGIDDLNGFIDLDNSYPKIIVGSWVIVAGGEDDFLPELPGPLELCHVDRVIHRSRTNFALSSRITRIVPDKTDDLDQFHVRNAAVFAQSEEMPLTDRPLDYPLWGTDLALGRVSPDLAREQE